MSTRQITVELPASVMAYVERQASEFGISIEAWLVRELELQRKLQDETDAFFTDRMKRAVPGSWRGALAQIPNGPPMPGDEVPEPRHT